MKIINSNLMWKGSFDYSNKPVLIVTHHAEASNCTIEDINLWHQYRGWIGCGYHYFVKKDGTIYVGRPENACGAHCIGVNDRSIGICAEGMYMKEIMPEAQKKAIIDLSRMLLNKYPSIKDIVRHCDLYPTSCCGSKYPFDEIKRSILMRSLEPSPLVIAEDKRDWLQVGDRGTKVNELQKKLNKLSYSVIIDGIYNKKTKNIVYKFQKDTHISADGLAGKETFSKLDELISSGEDKKFFVNSVDETKFIQVTLNKLKISSLKIDGLYGTQTSLAVKAFQSIVGIKADGIVGSETIGSLKYIISKPICGIKQRTPVATRYVQWRLGLWIDGFFGPITLKTIIAFQKVNKLVGDGIVGPVTWNKFFQ